MGKTKRKIILDRIMPEVTMHAGFTGDGCMGASCEDICCEYGCDVDKTSLDAIFEHRDKVEPLIGRRLEDCFSTRLKYDDDYSGGAYMETAVRRSDELCAFHLVGQRGCALFYLWASQGLPKTIVPTICRIFPLTWHRGRLLIDKPIREGCPCAETLPSGSAAKNLYETQSAELATLFRMKKKAAAVHSENVRRRRKDRDSSG